MRFTIALTFLLGASVALAGDRDAGKPARVPADFVHFAHSWEAAKAEAAERRVPIHITFHRDHCEECTRLDRVTYPDKDVIAASKLVVNVYCHGGAEHDDAKDYGAEAWCENAFGMVCKEHRRNHEDLKSLFFKGEPSYPTTIVCDPDGKEIERRAGFVSPKQLVEMFREAAAKAGPGLGRDEYLFARGRLDAGEESFAAGRTKEAIEALQAGVRMLGKHRAAKAMGDRLRAKLDLIEKSGADLVSKAKEDAAAGNLAAAREALRRVSTEFKSLECARAAERELASLSKSR